MNSDELLKLARLYFTDKEFSAITYESGPYDITNPTLGLKRFAATIFEMGYAKGKAEGFPAGAEDMRERAADKAEDYDGGDDCVWAGSSIAESIRALPISDSPNTFTTDKGEQG